MHTPRHGSPATFITTNPLSRYLDRYVLWFRGVDVQTVTLLFDRTLRLRPGLASHGRLGCRARRPTPTPASPPRRASAPSSTPSGRIPRVCPSTPCCLVAGDPRVSVYTPTPVCRVNMYLYNYLDVIVYDYFSLYSNYWRYVEAKFCNEWCVFHSPGAQ